jgi:hypothetical protein
MEAEGVCFYLHVLGSAKVHFACAQSIDTEGGDAVEHGFDQ